MMNFFWSWGVWPRLMIAALACTLLVMLTGHDGRTMMSKSTAQRALMAVPSVVGDTQPMIAAWATTAHNEQIQAQEQSPTPNTTRSDDAASDSAPTSEPEMDIVNQYLWNVYERSPIKRDGSGDFTWKDVAAAARLGMSLGDYVIGGMDRDFRELLYRAGLAMDAAGFRWTILSGFRDDYRQGLASGYKARASDTLHGGSATTGGYGHGCAVDIREADGDSRELWSWLDRHGDQLGLERPLAWIDPVHVQPRGPWHELAAALRDYRLSTGASPEEGAADAQSVDVGTTLPSAADLLCIGVHHHHDEAIETKTSAPGEARTFTSAARAHGPGKMSSEGEKSLAKPVDRFRARSSEGSRFAGGADSSGSKSARSPSAVKTTRSLARHTPPAVSHRGGAT